MTSYLSLITAFIYKLIMIFYKQRQNYLFIFNNVNLYNLSSFYANQFNFIIFFFIAHIVLKWLLFNH